MGIGTLLTWTGFYVVKYVVYIAVVVAAIFVGKAWAEKSKKAKSYETEQ